MAGYQAVQTLPDFIRTRAAELDKREAELVEQLAMVRLEIQQLQAAALAAGLQGKDGSAKQAERPEKSYRKAGPLTLKRAVLEALARGNGPMSALEILKEINIRYETDFPRTSLSPQLSRLRYDDRFVDRVGQKWFLTNLGRDEVSTEKMLPSGSSGGSDDTN